LSDDVDLTLLLVTEPSERILHSHHWKVEDEMRRSTNYEVDSIISEAIASGKESELVATVEKRLIEKVLLSCNFVQTAAAKKLGMNRNTIGSKIKQYEIEIESNTKDERAVFERLKAKFEPS
jgi:DNA-binding NtrC family response regulator